eukprot:Amastigsp_a844848_13.p3 type:complete len:223 gc:universal Amastigsp_a844848_13:852-184(-)
MRPRRRLRRLSVQRHPRLAQLDELWLWRRGRDAVALPQKSAENLKGPVELAIDKIRRQRSAPVAQVPEAHPVRCAVEDLVDKADLAEPAQKLTERRDGLLPKAFAVHPDRVAVCGVRGRCDARVIKVHEHGQQHIVPSVPVVELLPRRDHERRALDPFIARIFFALVFGTCNNARAQRCEVVVLEAHVVLVSDQTAVLDPALKRELVALAQTKELDIQLVLA